ncbi:MAG: pitrilysin family protein [Rikenellaceae bacterium]
MLPKIKKIDKVDLLHPEVFYSKKGVEIDSIYAPSGDVVRISLVFCAGVKYQSAPFIASATANLLSEGCGEYSAMQVAEILDFYGIYYDVSIDRDYQVITICSLGRFCDKALSLLENIVIRPKFLESECDVYTSKRKEYLKIEKEKMSVRSREEFVRTIFGQGHDYGKFAKPDDYDNINVGLLKDFYSAYYNRSNLFVAISGNVNREIIDAVGEIVDMLPKGENSRRETPQPEFQAATKRVENPQSVQSSINIGRVLFSRNHPDFVPMQVLSTILGGYFSSRLMQNIREDKGYTYGVHAATINLQDSGYFIISTEVVKEFTQSAESEIFKELEILQNELVSHEELEMVKRVIIGEMIRVLDGPFGICDVTIENIQNGVTNHQTEQMIKRIGEITPQDILRIANTYLRKEDLTSVVYC